MKKILSLILLSPALLFGAATTDIKPGLDPTGLSSITGAQLYQMVQGSVIATNKGAIVFGASTPDVANNVRFKTWIWLDSSTLPPSIKVYNTNTSAWVAQPVTAGAIGTNEITANAVISGKIAANAVYSTNIVNEEVSAADIASQSLISRHFFDNQISNAFMAVRTLEGGYLGSIALATITHTNIALGTIQGGNLASGTVTSNYIGESTIYAFHIAPTNVNETHLRTDAVTTDKITNSAVTAAKIADGVITTNKLASAAHQQLIKAWGLVDSGGTLANGYGASVVRAAQGIYVVTPTVAPGITNYAVSLAVITDVGNNRVARVATNTTTAFTVKVCNASTDAVQDHPFTFQLIY
jgi:hypothetical protein